MFGCSGDPAFVAFLERDQEKVKEAVEAPPETSANELRDGSDQTLTTVPDGVVPVGNEDLGALPRLRVDVEPKILALGERATVKVFESSGIDVDLSSVQLSFSSDNGGAVERDGTTVKASAKGTVFVTAEREGFQSACQELLVTDAVLTRLFFAPDEIRGVPVGNPTPFVLKGIFSDSDQAIDLTSAAQFSFGADRLRVDSPEEAGGAFSLVGLIPGASSVVGFIPSQENPSEKLGGLSAEMMVEFADAEVLSLNLSVPQQLTVGQSFELAVDAFLSSDPARPVDVTSDVTVEVSDTNALELKEGSLGKRTFEAKVAGRVGVTVRLTRNGREVSRSATILIVDQPRTLVGIFIDPVRVEIGSFGSKRFLARARYSSGSEEDVTSRVVWTSRNKALADFLSSSPGMLKAKSTEVARSFKVQASFDGMVAEADVRLLPPLSTEQAFEIGTNPEPKKVDVLFVLDVSGSMAAVIDRVRENLKALLQSMAGADVRYGLTFLERPDRSQRKSGGELANLRSFNGVYYNSVNLRNDQFFNGWSNPSVVNESYAISQRGSVYRYGQDDAATASLRAVEDRIDRVGLTNALVSENGLCAGLLGYQTLEKDQNRDGFRPDADLFSVVVISDEDAQALSQCRPFVKPGVRCLRPSSGTDCQWVNSPTEFENKGTDADPGRLVPKRVCKPGTVRSPDFRAQKSGEFDTLDQALADGFAANECRERPLEYTDTGSELASWDHYNSHMRRVKQRFSANRSYQFSFVGFTSAGGGCAPQAAGQSSGSLYLEAVGATAGRAACISDGDYGTVFADLGGNIDRVMRAYPLDKQASRIQRVVRIRGSAETELDRAAYRTMALT